MPAPENLRPILAALGDGGTVASAERIASAAGSGDTVTVELVMDAIGTGATRDVAERVVALYAPEPSGLDEFHPDTTRNPALAVVEPVEVPSEPADEDEVHDLGDLEPTDDEDDIVWDDEDATEPSPVEAAPASAAEVRAWAKANGVKVPARGAVPDAVRDAYNTAHA